MSYYERTYGEIDDVKTLHQEIINITSSNKLDLKNYLFYDFGSGYGKIVNYFSNHCLESIGIEIDRERYEKSLQFKSDNIHFLNFDFYYTKIKNPNIILINNLCLGIGTNKRLSLKLLNECTKNDILILTKKMVNLENYYLYHQLVKCSWGYSELYFYKFN